MALSLDILGFGSKRKTAFKVLDREWSTMDIDVRRIDGGIRHLFFQWAQETAGTSDPVDPMLLDFAAFSGYLMLGPELGARPFGHQGLETMSHRLEAALAADDGLGEDEEIPVDVRIVRLVLAAGLADRDIEKFVQLEQ